MQGSLRKVLIGNYTIEKMHKGIYASYLCQRPPRMFSPQAECHHRVGRRMFLGALNNSRFAVGIMRITECKTSLSQKTATVI